MKTEKNKIKVLHVLNSNSYSGAENVACQIINMFSKDDNISMFYCSPDGDINNTLASKNINYIPVKRLTVSEIWRVIKLVKPSIIHAHDMRASFLCAISNWSIPLISHIHNSNYDSRFISLKSIAYLFAGIIAKKIIWVSTGAFKSYIFHRVFENKSSILMNVIDTVNLREKIKNDSCDYDYDVIFLGRLSFEKNPERLVSIINLLKKRLPKVKVAIVGRGLLEEKLKQQVKEYNLDNNITFIGFRSNPYKILNSSKLMILTSLWEGLPMCVLEALALGIPVVSTPTAGVCEIIENGKNGFVSNKDYELEEYCYNLITNSKFRKKISENIIIKSKDILNLETYKKELNKLYNFCLIEKSK